MEVVVALFGPSSLYYFASFPSLLLLYVYFYGRGVGVCTLFFTLFDYDTYRLQLYLLST